MTDSKPKNLTDDDESALSNFFFSAGYVTGILRRYNEDELSEKIAEIIQLMVVWKKGIEND